MNLFHEIDLINEAIEGTDEVILLLNSFGQIINYNAVLTKNLHFDKDEFIGKPFRSIFGFEHIENKHQYENIILDKLKEVFRGNQSEIISPIWLQAPDQYISIHLKLIPKFIDDELSVIYAIGRFLKSDYITNSWLSKEKSHYIIDNDIKLVHIFCHRLTRNLDGKITRNKLLFIQLALQEVIINAIEHGNLEIDYHKKTELKQKGGNYWELLICETKKNFIEDRKVYITYHLEKDKVFYIIRDEGKGFNWQKYIDSNNSPHISISLHGLGLQLVKSTFDEINFNDLGNEVTLVKHF